MDTQKKEVTITPLDALTYCQNKLGEIPVTVAQYTTVIKPISEVVMILEQVKQALSSPPKQPEGGRPQPVPQAEE